MSLRDKFKKPITKQILVEQDQSIDSISSNVKRGDFLSIEPGVNKFRIMPGHPTEEVEWDTFIVPVNRWWLPFVNDEGKEYVKPIFDARVHSPHKVDPVDLYIKTVEEKYKGTDNEKEVLEIVYGGYGSKYRGLTGKPEWTMYAYKLGPEGMEFGRLSVGRAIKNDINDIIAREAANEAISTLSFNPLTDPDEGRLLIIEYNKEAKRPQDYYKTYIDTSFDRVTKKVKLYPLTDEQLEEFMEYPSLRSLYVNCYTSKDFDLALEGLQYFDKKYGLEVFESDEFISKIQKIVDLFPEESEADKQEEPSPSSDSASTPRKTASKTRKSTNKKEQAPPKRDLSWLTDESEDTSNEEESPFVDDLPNEAGDRGTKQTEDEKQDDDEIAQKLAKFKAKLKK